MDKKYLLFPQKLIVHDCEDFEIYQEKLIKHCYMVRDEEPNSWDYTMRHGWQSSTSEFRAPRFNPFLEFITKNIRQSIVSYGIDLSKTNFCINAIVLNINQPGSYQISHIHPSAHLSGVMWAKAPKNCGNIGFQNQNCFSLSSIMTNLLPDIQSIEKIQPYFYVEPQEGKMLLFPPELRHHVETNLSGEDRISIGFNILFDH